MTLWTKQAHCCTHSPIAAVRVLRIPTPHHTALRLPLHATRAHINQHTSSKRLQTRSHSGANKQTTLLTASPHSPTSRRHTLQLRSQCAGGSTLDHPATRKPRHVPPFGILYDFALLCSLSRTQSVEQCSPIPTHAHTLMPRPSTWQTAPTHNAHNEIQPLPPQQEQQSISPLLVGAVKDAHPWPVDASRVTPPCTHRQTTMMARTTTDRHQHPLPLLLLFLSTRSSTKRLPPTPSLSQSVVGAVECAHHVVPQLVLDGKGEVHVAVRKLTVRHLVVKGASR